VLVIDLSLLHSFW